MVRGSASSRGETVATKPAPALDEVLAELERLRDRCDRLEARLAAVEVDERDEADDRARTTVADDGEVREDTFGPAVKRTSSSGHLNAVNKALSMLGLVPDRAEETDEQRRAASEGHKRALGRALDMLGIAPKPEPDREAAARSTDAHRAATDKALEMLGRKPASAPADAEPAADAGAAAIEPPDEALGETFAPRWESEADVRRAEQPAIDFDEAVDIPLEQTSDGRAVAVPLLNGAVLVVAGAAALHAAGLVALPGQGADGPWFETLTGVAAALLAALTLAWRRASIHLRAFVGGTAVLLLNACALMLIRAHVPADPLPLLGACGAVAMVGARIVLATRHPFAIFLGLIAALLLPYWLAPGAFALWVAFALSTNVAIGACALRMRRLQPNVLAAVATALLLGFAPASLAAVTLGTCAMLYLGQALLAPFMHRRASNAAGTVALVSFGLLAWAVHGLATGPGLVRAAALFVPATVAAFVAGRLPRREHVLRAVLKAGAVGLVLSALPLGFAGQSLAAVTLFVGLLFGVFAYATFDAYLRAAGALMLVVGAALTLAAGPTPALWFGAAVCAAVLHAVRAKGPDPVALRVLLVALAHGTTLAGIALVVPAATVPYWWGGLALVYAVVAGRLEFEIVRAGAALAAGAAATAALATPAPDPVTLGATALLLAPHAWLARPSLRPRTSGLFLLLFELMGVTTLLVALPGPLGVLAALPLLGVMALPVWGGWTRLLRAHARFLTFVLLARCLFPDFVSSVATPGWLDLRLAAMAAALVPALVVVRFARSGRAPATFLALLVVVSAVASETGDWRLGLAALLPTGLVFGLLFARGRAPAPEAESVAEDEPAAEPEPVSADV